MANYKDESALRGKLIRLAHENPELRNDLLPMITASEKTAAISMSDIDRINFMTDRNDHNGAAKATAEMLGLKRHVKVFEGIQTIQEALGHMPSEASDLRYRMLKEVYAKAQKTYIKDEDGDKINVYSLLD